MEEFKPSEYVSGLIEAVNDGARTAQGGALALAALGFYLMAVSFSTTDLDLLLDHTTSISQLGLQVAPPAVFGVAPLVFLAVHSFTLVRFDMLSANLRFLRRELDKLPQENQERCRQLLANVEFIMAAIAPRTSPLYSWLFKWVWIFTIAGFPVLVILVVQIFSIRYQSAAIIAAQRAALCGDLGMLIWFFWRADPDRNTGDTLELVHWKNVLHYIRRYSYLWRLPLLIFVLDVIWISQPADNAKIGNYWKFESVPKLDLILQPFDNLLCPNFGWGCRYLTGTTQTLVGQFFPDELMEINQKTRSMPAEEALVSGVFLRGRSLRFARLTGADLTNAELRDANLSRANLDYSYLNGADLFAANLTKASLYHADLTDAVLEYATLDGANFTKANLAGADLSKAKINDTANFGGATYTTYDTNGQCATTFPAGFPAELKDEMIALDDGEAYAPNPHCVP